MSVKDTTSQRNARLVIASSFFSDLTFVLPVWLLYSINYLDLTPSVATILFTSIWLVSGLLEVPTGALADRYGRKRAFLIGYALMIPFPLAYVFNPPLAIFGVLF